MMKYASDVSAAVQLVNSPQAPDYLLTFNEPDYSYQGETPTMSPQEAAQAIAPLIASPGTHTKFIAPAVAHPDAGDGDWLQHFYKACNCQNFFYAYSMHLYVPDLVQSEKDIAAFHADFPDKPLWVTEIAPGSAQPSCSLSVDTVTQYMQGLYKWGAEQPWLQRIFWNSANQIPNDQNVCNSYLLGTSGSPSPLLGVFNAIDCS